MTSYKIYPFVLGGVRRIFQTSRYQSADNLFEACQRTTIEYTPLYSDYHSKYTVCLITSQAIQETLNSEPPEDEPYRMNFIFNRRVMKKAWRVHTKK